MPDQPNILFVFPDQWRADSLSYLGHPVAQTPFLDEIASTGTTFTRAYSNCPICIPARACLITGQTPSTAGRFAYQEGVPWRYDLTLMTCLRNAGYQTMCSGKTHFHPPRASLGFEQIQLYDSSPTMVRSGDVDDYGRWLRQKTGGLIEDTISQLTGNSMIAHPWTHDEALHANSWTVTAALDMLERRDPTRPFFMHLGFHRPHPPLDPPVEFFRRFENAPLPDVPVGEWVGDRFTHTEWRHDHISGVLDPRMLDRARRAYYAQLAHLDFQVGRIMRWLHLHNLMDKLMVVFCTDHGEQLGDHRIYRKSTFLQGSAAVPLIVRMPKGQRGGEGTRCDKPVALHDLMPTFLDAAGVAIPSTVEGRSVLPLTRDAASPWRDHVHLEQSDSPFGGGWQCLTDGRQKYAWLMRSGEEFFFDLTSDPQELHNLAGDAKYAADISRWRAALVGELSKRPADQLTEDGRLKIGAKLPAVRPELLADRH